MNTFWGNPTIPINFGSCYISVVGLKKMDDEHSSLFWFNGFCILPS
ncbi:MAG: hypothetical protein HYX60_10290 [Legionella longbeachae]|nr:hypothetical protein [Legionella longbeachae]